MDVDFYLTPAAKRYLRVFEEWLREERPELVCELDQCLAQIKSREGKLTDRQRQILSLRIQGNSREQIARRLDIDVKTVGKHWEAIINKAKTSDPYGILIWAIKQNQLSTPTNAT